MTTEQLPPSVRINQLYWGFAISRAVHVAAKFGIADHVPTNGITTSNLALALHVNEDRLYRLMRLLASYEIFTETQKYTFKPTSLSDAIKTDEPGSVRYAAHLITKSMWDAYGHLEHSITTGEDTYTELFGKGVFDYLDEHKDESDQFDRAMHNYAELENPVIADCLDLGTIKHLVDVGGGQGGFLKEILLLNSNLEGTLFDQEHVVKQALIPGDEATFVDRVSISGGSFFESVPVADAFIMKRILHDWSNDDCCRILETCVKSMPDTGKLFVVDAIVPDGNVPHFSKDLEAFLMTWGGQERDLAEFETLFDRVGLKVVSVTETPSLLSIIEAVKK